MLKFQYNKTELQRLNYQLKLRVNALPILKNKETALRQSIKKMKNTIEEMVREEKKLLQEIDKFDSLWSVFVPRIAIKKKEYKEVNIVGLKVSELIDMQFEVADQSYFYMGAWQFLAVETLKKLILLQSQLDNKKEIANALINVRKKTTQKVNLYEKVQIPGYEQAILKIKRFLEDRQTIQKAAQKIVKERQRRKEAAA